jgi:hypothetical protein
MASFLQEKNFGVLIIRGGVGWDMGLSGTGA